MPKATLEAYKQEIESYLQVCLEDERIPQALAAAMRYSLLAGGKRIRPILCLVWAQMLGEKRDRVLPFASGLECIHTYSLIHDDLPAMDDDDLRRGRPANHKRLGEAMAILAGDGLLTQAFGLMLQTPLSARRVLRAMAEVAEAAGGTGMVGGQVQDMQLTGSGLEDSEQLRAMHIMKTGRLLQAACMSGGTLAGAKPLDIQRAETYGQALGLAFQVADDILDVTGDQSRLGKPVGSDQGGHKVTYPALLGLEKSRLLGQGLIDQAQAALAGRTGEEASFLHHLAQYVMDRTK